jgi:diaminopimelate decarboxylase
MSEKDLQFALDKKILINISEINLLEKLAKLGNRKCSIRLNLDIGSGHHHHVVTGSLCILYNY